MATTTKQGTTDYSQGPWATVKMNWPNMLVWLAVFLVGLAIGAWAF